MSATSEISRTATARPLLQATRPRGAATRTRRTVGAFALAGILVTSGLFALSAAGTPGFFVPASRYGLAPWLAGPLQGAAFDWGILAPLLLLAGMFACYVGVLAVASAIGGRSAVAAIGVLHLLFLLSPVLLSTDVFGYLAFARLEAAHGLNPYIHAVEEIPGDPINAYLSAVWPTSLSTPYGPLFVLTTSALVPLGIPAATWILKVATAAAALGCVALVAGCARALGRPPVPAALFVGLNPLWLAWALGGAHNDLLMMLLLMVGAYLVVAERERLGAAAIVAASVGIKATAGLVLPFVFVASPRRGAVVAGAAIAGVAIALLALAAMGFDFLGYAAALGAQAEHMSSQSVPQALGHLLGLGGITGGLRLAMSLAFVVAVALLLASAWRRRRWIEPAGWAMVALLLTSSSLHPWYIVGLAPLAAVGDSRALRVATVVMTLLLAVIKLTP